MDKKITEIEYKNDDSEQEASIKVFDIQDKEENNSILLSDITSHKTNLDNKDLLEGKLFFIKTNNNITQEINDNGNLILNIDNNQNFEIDNDGNLIYNK